VSLKRKKKIDMFKIICDNCGKSFERNKAPNERNFCSSKCTIDYRRKNKTGWHSGSRDNWSGKNPKQKLRANNLCM